MIALPSSTRTRLGALVRMFSNENDHEALAALRATGRTLKAVGADFQWLADRVERESAPRVIYVDRAQPSPEARASSTWTADIRARVKTVLHRAIAKGVLSSWEFEFARSVMLQMASSATWRPSPKQQATIATLVAKAEAAGVRA